MDKRRVQDAETARFIRRKQKGDGHDEEEDHEDEAFFNDPNKALNRHAKQRTQKNIQKQVQYFGNAIQPFHMREQEQIGQIDGQGFFVFNKKNRVRDAWLDSIGQGDDAEVADQLVKKIKKQSRFQSVYEAGQGLNKNLNEDQQEQEQGQKQDYEGGGIEEAPQSEQEQAEDKLNIQQLIELILQLIPPQVKTNANNYMKKLKKQKQMDEYNKLLTVSNQYIEKTGEYDILTKKRQQLQEMLDQIVEANRIKNVKGIDVEAKIQEAEKILDWDNDDQSDEKNEKQNVVANQKESQNKKNVEENQSESNQSDQQNDNDDIF